VVDLVAQAFAAGASRACLIPADRIRTNPELADLCTPDSCSEYGLAPTCPPYVSGPAGFRQLQQRCDQALVIRLDVPEEALRTERRTLVFRKLQEIAAGLEQAALRNGCREAYAFAGGSCKKLFCHQEPDCAVLARKSMSGFGIDLLALMRTCNWPATFIDIGKPADKNKLSWVAALILLGPRGNSPT